MIEKIPSEITIGDIVIIESISTDQNDNLLVNQTIDFYINDIARLNYTFNEINDYQIFTNFNEASI